MSISKGFEANSPPKLIFITGDYDYIYKQQSIYAAKDQSYNNP